jgi:hypothetical protein
MLLTLRDPSPEELPAKLRPYADRIAVYVRDKQSIPTIYTVDLKDGTRLQDTSQAGLVRQLGSNPGRHRLKPQRKGRASPERQRRARAEIAQADADEARAEAEAAERMRRGLKPFGRTLTAIKQARRRREKALRDLG